MENIYSMDTTYDSSKIEEKQIGRYALATAIAQEVNGDDTITYENSESRNVYKALFDDNDSSVKRILASKFGINITEYEERSTEDKFKLYKLLRLIYLSKQKKYGKEKGKSILSLLSTPSIEHTDADNAKYAEQFQDMLAEVQKGVEKPEIYEESIRKIHWRWTQLHRGVGDESTLSRYETDNAIERAYQLLSNLLMTLKMQLFQAYSQNNQEGLPRESIIDRFYLLMLSYRCIAEIESLKKIRYADELTVSPETRKLFRSSELNRIVPWEEFAKLIDRKNADPNDKAVKVIWQFLDLAKANDTDYRFAARYTQPVAEMWRSHRREDTAAAPLFIWVIVMQELMRIQHNAPEYDNRYIGYANAPLKLTAAIKNLKKASSLAKMVLLGRLDDSWYSLLGNDTSLKYKKQIDEVLYEIEEVIFTWRPMPQIEYTHRNALYQAVLSLASHRGMQNVQQWLNDRINSKLSDAMIMLSCICIPNMNDITWTLLGALEMDRYCRMVMDNDYQACIIELYETLKNYSKELEAVVNETGPRSESDPMSVIRYCTEIGLFPEKTKQVVKDINSRCAYYSAADKIAAEIIRLHGTINEKTLPVMHSAPIEFEINYGEDAKYIGIVDFDWNRFNGTIEIRNFVVYAK